MGYTTDFWGEVEIVPPLNAEEVEFLKKFNHTRRMDRKRGPYFVDGTGHFGQDREEDIVDYNRPPEGQPGLWCQWIPTDDGKYLKWDEGEKFYNSAEWMVYLIDHFLGAAPYAMGELPFLQGHTLNGVISAQGEEGEDRWDLIVEDNVVYVERYGFVSLGREEV